MKLLGKALVVGGVIHMPEGFAAAPEGTVFEAVEIEGCILLKPSGQDRGRFARVQRLADLSIEAHRHSLEGLSR